MSNSVLITLIICITLLLLVTIMGLIDSFDKYQLNKWRATNPEAFPEYKEKEHD